MIYETPLLEVIHFGTQNVITTSPTLDPETGGSGENVSGGWNS